MSATFQYARFDAAGADRTCANGRPASCRNGWTTVWKERLSDVDPVATVNIVKPSLAFGGNQAKEGYEKYRPRKAQMASAAGRASKLSPHAGCKTRNLPA